MLRDMYAHNLSEDVIKSRIVEQVDTERFRKITHSTLEGLAKRELNLSAIVGKSAEAKERRLVPEVIEGFFTEAAPLAGLSPKETRRGEHVYRIGKIPRTLWPIGERLEPRFGKLGREYKQIVFDKKRLTDDPTLEWVTPGHALFETVREDVLERVQKDLQRGRGFLRHPSRATGAAGRLFRRHPRWTGKYPAPASLCRRDGHGCNHGSPPADALSGHGTCPNRCSRPRRRRST